MLGQSREFRLSGRCSDPKTVEADDMLTRLEVDGFKNLVGFTADFGPYTCIAGPNGTGKSNVFDAIHFLSLLADHSILEAAVRVRTRTDDTARLDDLFFRGSSIGSDSFRISAEMLVEQDVTDDFGRPGRASSTFLRYEVEFGKKYGHSERTSLSVFDIELRSESLHHIRQGDAGKRLRFPHSKAGFRDKAVRNRRFAKSGYISTEQSSDSATEIVVHQDGGSRGPGQRAPAHTAPRTIVGTTNTVATPTILAARREMQKWRLLSLEPSAMRRPDRLGRDPTVVSDNGAHLAAALNRLKETDVSGGSVVARVSARLAELVPVLSVDVERDDVRELLTLSVTESGGARFPANAISDGTLRFLALSILAEDPEAKGLICIEEPENGIHPQRLPAMASLIRDLAVDASYPIDSENIMRQVILATHSPYFFQLQEPDDVLLAEETTVRYADSSVKGLRCYALKDSWRATAGDGTIVLGLSMMKDYLQPPEGVQLRLPLHFY